MYIAPCIARAFLIFASHEVFDLMNSFFGVRGIPPFRQREGERMGHGVGTKSSGARHKQPNLLVVTSFFYIAACAPH